jgi:FAD/FMN-containing dehydrogenase
MKRRVSSWGRISADFHEVIEPTSVDRLSGMLRSTHPGLPLGAARSYGDCCLNPGGLLWSTARLDRFHSFDLSTGRLVCESGVLLQDIQRTFVPRGWSLPVVPGTQLVTVGGAIANDVHGKNHHLVGSFGRHVRRLRLVRTDGRIIDCAPDREEAWFAATVGGIGLTGLIATADLQLHPVAGPWVDAEIVPFSGVAEFLSVSREAEASWEHTVAWLDCTTARPVRGLLLRASMASDQSGPISTPRRFSVPVTPPFSIFGRATLPLLNQIYYRMNRSRRQSQRYLAESFLFPLDGIGDWNRLYGPRGFYQYQLVVPFGSAEAALEEVLRTVACSGEGSLLAVMKVFGDAASPGLLSFPMPGVTLSLDFPNLGSSTERLLSALDSITLAVRGRVYLAKDARMTPRMFEEGYVRAHEFQSFRDPGISSAMSNRLMGR